MVNGHFGEITKEGFYTPSYIRRLKPVINAKQRRKVMANEKSNMDDAFPPSPVQILLEKILKVLEEQLKVSKEILAELERDNE